jgi:hypothetical protein
MTLDLTLSPRQNRIVAIALALIPVALILFLAAPALSGYWEHRDRIDALQRQMLTYQVVIASMPRDRAALAEFRRSPELNDLVLPHQQATAGMAELQNRIGEIASAANARVMQSTSEVRASDGALIELSTRIVVEGDIAAVSLLLHELEKARPLLIVRRFTIRDPDGEDASATSTGPNVLQAELDVSGFMRLR